MTEEITQNLIIDLHKAHAKIQKRVSNTLAIHGLSLSDYLVLNQLFNAPTKALRRSDLAEEVGLSPSGITRLLNPLEKIGLVDKEPNPRDARVSMVALTESGEKTFRDAQITFSQVASSMFDPLLDEQLKGLATMLRKFG